MAYDFFVSYTRANNDIYLRQFIEDLAEVVSDLRGHKGVDFFDQSDLELGEDWDAAIVEALQTSGVVLSLFSPAYFKSEYCGRELALFCQRRALLEKPGNPAPPLLKPIVWVPFKDDEVPAAINIGQRTFGDPQGPHNQKGFKYLLKQLQEYKVLYNDLVNQLGVEIIQAVDAHPLPRLPKVPALREVRSIFAAAGAAPGTPPLKPSPSGPKHVRFVYVAASPEAFGAARGNGPYLDAGGSDWKPFFPMSTVRIHRLLQGVVANDELDFTSEELPFDVNLIGAIDEALKRRQIVVLIVDGWTLQWNPDYRAILSDLDRRLDYHWCVLVPWNEQDPDSVTKRAEIAQAINETFDRHANLAKNPMFYRDGIKSVDELKAALKEVLTRLKEEMRKRAPVDMPVPAGPAKSVLSGPGGQV